MIVIHSVFSSHEKLLFQKFIVSLLLIYKLLTTMLSSKELWYKIKK